MYERILVCLDGSELAEQVLPYATEQAKCFGSKLLLLQVASVSSTVVAASAAGGAVQTEQIIRQEIARAEAEAGSYLERVAGDLESQGLDVEPVVLRDAVPGEAIVAYAEKMGAGLIALATHGRSGLSRAVFGSVADHILRASGLPILVIRPRELKT